MRWRSHIAKDNIVVSSKIMKQLILHNPNYAQSEFCSIQICKILLHDPNFAQSNSCTIQILLEPNLHDLNIARFKSCAIEILCDPNHALSKPCTIQIFHDPNPPWSKPCTIQVLHNPNLPWSKSCTNQILHNPNLARCSCKLFEQIQRFCNTVQTSVTLQHFALLECKFQPTKGSMSI